MTKSKIYLLSIVIFFAFLFITNVKAATVWLTYDFSYAPYYNLKFNIEYYNNDTGEFYYTSTSSKVPDLSNTYNIGSVPDGNYSISIHPQGWNYLPYGGDYFTWVTSENQGGQVLIESGYFSELTNDIDIVNHLEIYLTN